MLDFFTIFSKGGILLWCFKGADLLPKDWDAFTPAVNKFIKTVLLQEKSGNRTAQFESGSLALKYKLDNEFELVFIAAFQKMLPLLYLDKLLDEIQLLFRDKFSKDLQDRHLFSRAYSSFTPTFESTLKRVEMSVRKSGNTSNMKSFEESEKSKKTLESMIVKPNAQTTSSDNNNVAGKKKASKPPASVTFSPKVGEPNVSEVGNSNENKENVDLDEETRMANMARLAGKKGSKVGKSPKSQKSAKQGKQKTTWDPFTFGGSGAKGQEAANLDYFSKHAEKNGINGKEDDSANPTDHQLEQFVPDRNVIGISSELKDLEIDDSDSSSEEGETPEKASSKGYGIWSSLSGLVGSKPLTREDIEPIISKIQDHLMAKNVASDVAINLCNSVTNKLEGQICGTFQSVQGTVKESMNTSLMKLLTPSRRVDIIRDVREAKSNKRPYVITFCGVNGVGKSTNLAKICFWLVENNCRVLIAACDTFRAGAVEQLRTHVRRLNSLYPTADQSSGKPVVELYEKGYGKDAAGIAMEAINYARQSKNDVVLVDTAGRMQDNEPLMRSLAKLITVNDPDLVLFVGEALVGNEAVDQLVKFNQALSDYSPSQTNPHLIDGIVLTKFDTIDDKVGSAISMTYITGQPILFVGTGQTYTDLKSLNAKSVVASLMK